MTNEKLNAPLLRHRRFRTTVLLGVGIVLCAGLSAQETIDRDHPGKWTVLPPIKAKLHGSVPAADAAAANLWVNQVFDVMHRLPMLASPRGFDVIPQALLELDTIDGSSAPSARQYVYAAIDVDLAQYENGSKGSVANDRDAPATIRIEVNRLGPVVGGASMASDTDDATDDQGTLMINPPAPDGDFHGYPVFQVNYDRYVVLRRNNVPFFVPVSRERFLRHKIKTTQAQLDKAQAEWAKNKGMIVGLPNAAEITQTMTENLTRLQHTVDGAKKELAAMSPSTAASAAYVDMSDDSEGVKFVAKDDGAATAIVNVNPALIDPKLPRSTPQIMTVDIATDTDKWPDIAAQLDQQIDWAALEKILHE